LAGAERKRDEGRKWEGRIRKEKKQAYALASELNA
jgi:hypothetical protein